MSEKQEFIKWLEMPISKNECIMNKVIDIYSDLEIYLEQYNISYKEDFNTMLIKLAYFLYINSSNSGYLK